MTSRVLPAAALLAAILASVAAHAQDAGDAYADPAARALVQGARARRNALDLSILEYRTLSTDRFSVAHRFAGRERVLYRRDTATRVHWRRSGTIDMEIVGAREGSPVAGAEPAVPGDLSDFFHLAFDPLDSEFLFRLDTTMVHHPFAAGSEAHYRFAAGDSASIRLPDGRTVRLRELRIMPRRNEGDLVTGSFWLHVESHAVVQATFRPAAEFRMRVLRTDSSASVQISSSARGKVPFYLRPFRAEITQITLDYGLWDLRWWLPRHLQVAGLLEAGPLGALTLRYELGYRDYEVTAGPAAVGTDSSRVLADSAALPCRGRRLNDVTVLSGPDSLRARWERKARWWREERRTAPDSAGAPCTRQYRVSAPATEDSLLASAHLPVSLHASSELLTTGEIDELADRLRKLPPVPWGLVAASLDWGPGMLRYNRVEALGAGLRGEVELGRGQAGAELRYGIADERLKGRVHFRLRSHLHYFRISAYQDLHTVDESAPALSLGSSLRALFLGQDDAFYYRTRGAALEITPAPGLPRSFSLRLYAERQAAASRNTNFSLPHLLDSDFRFRDNITADPARQLGAELIVQRELGQDPTGFQLGLRGSVRAEAGTFDFIRPDLSLRLNPPALGPVVPGLELAGGTTIGAAPAQSLWYLGGARTLRGYHAGDDRGPAYWRARVELGTALPGVRVSLFSDVGRAGETGRAALHARPLWSAGAGVSLLDGMVRLDLARALRQPTGWRLHFYLGGVH